MPGIVPMAGTGITSGVADVLSVAGDVFAFISSNSLGILLIGVILVGVGFRVFRSMKNTTIG